MNKTISLFFLLSISLFAKSQNFLTDIDSITIERFDTINKDMNRYNYDNKIYRIGNEYYFDFYYQDKKGIKFLYKEDTTSQKNGRFNWNFVNYDSINNQTITNFKIRVLEGLEPFIRQDPDYHQTKIQYDFITQEKYLGNEWTGLIENDSNIWMHPPRMDLFMILEINPFPYIKFPLQIGRKWSWFLSIGPIWSDKRWIEWSSRFKNVYNYEVIDKKAVDTKIGKLDCFVISGVAKSKLGETKLISYFNSKFGFVKLDYTNIDKTKLIIEINKINIK